MTKIDVKMTSLADIHDLNRKDWRNDRAMAISCFNLCAIYCSTAEKSFILDFPAALYLDKCEADGGLKVYVKATVKENGQRFASYDTVDFQRPSLFMEVCWIWFTALIKRHGLGTVRI